MTDLLNWPGGLAALLILAITGALALRLTRDHRETLPFQTWLFIGAFALRAAAGAAIYGGGLLRVLHDEDSRAWTGGITFMQQWMASGFTSDAARDAVSGLIGTENRGYQSLLGVFFLLTRLVGRLPAMVFTAFIAALGIVITYRTARLFAAERAARWVGIVLALLPLMIIWGSQTLKEPVVITLEAAAFYALVRIGRGSSAPRHWVAAFLTLLLVIPFRFYIAYALGAALLFVIWRRETSQPPRRSLRVASSLAVVMVLALLTREVVAREDPGLQRVQQFRESVSTTGAALARPDSAAAGRMDTARRDDRGSVPSSSASASRPQVATLDVRKPWQLPAVLLIGAAYALLSPFPWQFGGGSWRLLFTAPDMIIWWCLFFAVIVRGVWRALRHHLLDLAPLVLFLVMIGGLYSLMYGNVGIAYRQRAQLAPVLLILAAAGLRPRESAA
jgi:4-amino-4-deoxy-L-arabinose transferase-like glycosyltransferase